MEIWEDLGISIVLTVIKQAFKNPEKAEYLKAVLLKIRDKINLLYPEKSNQPNLPFE